MNRLYTLLLMVAAAIVLAAFHPSPDSPAICYGISLGSAGALFLHWVWENK